MLRGYEEFGYLIHENGLLVENSFGSIRALRVVLCFHTDLYTAMNVERIVLGHSSATPHVDAVEQDASVQ